MVKKIRCYIWIFLELNPCIPTNKNNRLFGSSETTDSWIDRLWLLMMLRVLATAAGTVRSMVGKRDRRARVRT